MSKQLAILALLLGAAIAVSACTAAPAPAPQPPAPAAQAPAPAAQPPAPAAPAPAKPAEAAPASATSSTDATSVMVSKDPTLISIMTDGKGRALYLFTKDERNKSNCVDACAQNWPPLTVKGEAKSGAGATSALIGATARADGSTQVTYNGWPLYYFAKDEKPGDVKGQNVGAVWFALSMDGSPIQNAAPVNIAKNATLGTVLADASGRTLYLFAKDEKNKSTCTGGCAQTWPPLLSKDAPKAGEGVTAVMLGTITRADGFTQVTYNGLPLYYFARDEKPGDVKGQNVGGNWFVVNPAGEAVKPVAAAPPSAPATAPMSAPTSSSNSSY